MKIYVLRHQAAGYVVQFPFEDMPTEAQLAPIRAKLAATHGDVHPKLEQPWWDRIEEIEVVPAGAVPKVDAPSAASAAGSGSGELVGMKAEGRGTVRNPKGA